MYQKSLQIPRITLSLILLTAGSLVAVVPATAQTHIPVQARVTQAVDTSTVVTLGGNTRPQAQAQFDTGVASASLPADRLLLILKRSDQQEADLQQFLASVQDSKSSNYRKFLTPEQFGQIYGPADADINAVTSWLQGQGFLVAKVNKARTTVEFSGSSGQVQNAFRTAIHSYVINGEQHYANASDPQIPAALAPVIAGIVGLHDFRPRPYATLGPTGQYDANAKQFLPQYTTGTSPNNFLFVGPADAATIYNAPSVKLNKNFSVSGGSINYDGTGVTIGVVGDSNINTVDNDNYRALFGLPAKAVNVIVDGQDPGITAGGQDEALLDTQIAGGLAPGATVNLYISADTTLQSGLFLAINRAINDNVVDILNVSFGNCEFNLGGTNQNLSDLWEQAAAQGITVTVSTGDSGSAGCDDFSTQTSATHGLAVNGFASTPYNVAVGGTDFDTLASKFSTYVGTTNTPPYFGTVTAPIDPVLGTVIPENPWNNSTEPNTGIANNIAFKDPTTGATNIVAAGGGRSSCATQTLDATGNTITCDSGYAKPIWQFGLQSQNAQGNDGVRDVPDVSLFASNGFYNAAWTVCRDGDCILNNGALTSTTTVHGFGGTSTSAPAFAGILALVIQEETARLAQPKNVRLGQANNVLYPLAIQHPSVYHDVTVGDISVPCTTTTPNCTNGFLTGFDAGTGYDLATGLGSVDITALVKYWQFVTFLPTTTTFTLSGGTSPVTVIHGQAVTYSAAVSSASGTPTGVVAVVTDNPAVNAGGLGVLTLGSSADANGQIYTFPGGTYNVTARYSGDATFASSTSAPPISLTVTQEPSVTNFTVGANRIQVPASGGGPYPYGSVVVAFVQPAGTSAGANFLNGIATGTATFSDNGSVLATATLNSSGLAEYDNNGLPVGNHVLTARYLGDPSFAASDGGPVSFAITQAPSTTTVSPSIASVPGSGSLTVTAAVTTTSRGVGPTGNVTFFAGTTQLGTAVAVTPVNGSRAVNASASASLLVEASSLATGANSVTAVYSGDANYVTSTSAATTVTVTAAFTLSAAAPTSAVIAPGISTASTITVTPFGGFTGSVTFTCSVVGKNASSDVHVPACSAASVSVPAGTTAAVTATASVTTTAPVTTAALHYPDNHQDRWLAAGGGAILACVVFFGIPARRRSWRAMLGMFVFLAALTVVGCGGGGGGSSGGGGGTTTPGTTADTYTATVTGTSGTITTTTTFTFTVN